MGDILSDFFDGFKFAETNLAGAASPDNIFSIFESFDEFLPVLEESSTKKALLVSQKSTSPISAFSMESDDLETNKMFEASSPKCKKQKLMAAAAAVSDEANLDGQQQVSHTTVERNRRKQMNEHLSVLRSLMPCFYVKRADQASIIGGVVDYINELQQVLQALEAKKQRKVYSEVLSPRVVSSPRLISPPILSPRKPPLSPRLNLPTSPRTPQQPSSPYKPPPRLQQLGANYYPPCSSSSSSSTNITTTTSSIDNIINNEIMAANSKSSIVDVEVKFSGPNLLLKTVSPRIHGQGSKIISTLEDLSLEVLHASISTIDDTMINSFTIKIGIECQLSAEELAHLIQQTFC